MAEQRNNAAMREALVIAKKAICHHAEHICQSLSWENSTINANCADILCAHRDLCEAKTAIQKALAAPPRNCDVGTAEEQQNRFREFCRHHESEGECGIGRSEAACPAFHGWRNPDCSLWWAQMPFDSRGKCEDAQ